ncbi:MAG: T9SS type A sorting domain-containing protein [Bacteroidia bacterium]
MMKKSVYTFLLCFFLAGFARVSGQSSALMDFSWSEYVSSSYTSDTTLMLCEGSQVMATLTTSLEHSRNWNGSGPISVGHPSGSALVPWPTLGLPLSMVTTLSFSAPVSNLRVLIRDLDDDVPAAGPEETFSDFRINGLPRMPDAIQATQGAYSVSGNVVTPLAANCNGWFVWNGPGIQSMSWTYERDNDHYAFLLDSLEFACDNSTGVAEAVGEKGFEIFPNPAADVVNLIGYEIQHLGTGPLNLEVINAEGKVVMQTQPLHAEVARGYTLKVNRLAAGVYMVRLSGDNGSYSRRLVVMGK